MKINPVILNFSEISLNGHIVRALKKSLLEIKRDTDRRFRLKRSKRKEFISIRNKLYLHARKSHGILYSRTRFPIFVPG
jgi:hypothetical protein